MPDDLTKKRPLDASRINIHEPYEVRWWCSELQVTESDLIKAVNAVGDSTEMVKRYLGRY